MMAQTGMEFNPNALAQMQMYQSQVNQDQDQTRRDMSGLYDASMNLIESANPYYEMQSMQPGGQPWVNPYGYYGAAPYLIPMNQQPYFKFRTNVAPGPQGFFPGMDPRGAKNFNYDYRGRLFGPGPRRVKMSWDEWVPNMPQKTVPQTSTPPVSINPNITPSIVPGGFHPPMALPEQSQMRQGGVYELTQDQINTIMQNGGEIEYVD
jgi:hypothetical protein